MKDRSKLLEICCLAPRDVFYREKNHRDLRTIFVTAAKVTPCEADGFSSQSDAHGICEAKSISALLLHLGTPSYPSQAHDLIFDNFALRTMFT